MNMQTKDKLNAVVVNTSNRLPYIFFTNIVIPCILACVCVASCTSEKVINFECDIPQKHRSKCYYNASNKILPKDFLKN